MNILKTEDNANIWKQGYARAQKIILRAVIGGCLAETMPESVSKKEMYLYVFKDLNCEKEIKKEFEKDEREELQ